MTDLQYESAKALLRDSSGILKELGQLNGKDVSAEAAMLVYIANGLVLLVQAVVLQTLVTDERRVPAI